MVSQYFHTLLAQPEQMDALWAEGWRHFGTFFFRYATNTWQGKRCTVLPLRIDIPAFSLSQSQKRILKRNADLRVIIRETFIDEEKEALFDQHKNRFSHNVPENIYSFLSPVPDSVPCLNREICVFEGDKLLAVSFLDLGETATSAVYAMFDLAESKRSLGIFLILVGIRFSQENGFRYYYPGYAYREPSFYDYKKRFSGLEYYDWKKGWKPFKSGLRTED